MRHMDEIIICGEVVNVAIDEEFSKAEIEERFKMIRPIVLLGEYRYAVIIEVERFPG